MKKILFSLVLLLLSRGAFAAYASGGNILQPQTKYNTSTGYLTLDIDWSGFPTGFSITASTTLNAGTNFVGSFSLSQTGAVAVDARGSSVVAYIPTGQGVSITASPSQNSLSATTYVWQTYTAAVHNLTSVAGANVRCVICLGPSFGGAGIRVGWGTSATAPSDLYSVGAPIATSANAQCFGPHAPGTIFYSQGSGSSAVTGRIQVDGVY